MKIGYARVSTKDQSLEMQIDALKAYGCDKIFQEVVSGGKAKRKVLSEMILTLRPDDIVAVYKLDRLGRSLKHLVNLIDDFNKKQIHFVSLNDPVDTTTSQGRLMFNIFCSLAEFEREIIRERTNAGLAAARSRGRVGGRPKGLSEEAKQTATMTVALYKSGKYSIKEICKNLNISTATVYNYLRYEGAKT